MDELSNRVEITRILGSPEDMELSLEENSEAQPGFVFMEGEEAKDKLKWSLRVCIQTVPSLL